MLDRETIETILEGGAGAVERTSTHAPGPAGRLPWTAEFLASAPSGRLFGQIQDVGMGWDPASSGGKAFLLLSTQGGIRAPDGSPIALGYHAGHFELHLLLEAAAEELRRRGAIPYGAFCSDPCDGRTQGTPGMMDSLPFRNDAAAVFRRLVRSLPERRGVLGAAACDKGLPALLMALASARDLPCVVVPGGVTLPPEVGEDLGTVQSIGARFAHGEVTLEYASEVACRACASSGGACQFLGTAASAQVVAEALGMSLPHTALAPSGEEVWLDAARRSARALLRLEARGLAMRDLLTEGSVRNAMAVHVAFGGSTNLLIHLPAIAHAAGLRRPAIDDWIEIERRTPRLADVLPNGPHPTVRAFLAGGVPEAMLHLRALGLLDLDALTVAGERLGALLEWWEASERRRRALSLLRERDGFEPEDVILPPDRARERGFSAAMTFPRGNLAPEGSVVKSTAIDRSLLDAGGVYRHEGPARVFVREPDAVRAIAEGRVRPGDVLVLVCAGPLGSGMEEILQVTGALRHLSWGKRVAVVTDARFSGVTSGACIGHASPEALAGGPLGKVLDGDRIEISIDTRRLEGRLDLVGEAGDPPSARGRARGDEILGRRPPRPDLSPRPDLPDDTELWAALQAVGGGVWGGCVFDVDAILARLAAGERRPG
ncbi:MAG: YjhG/YagF family D-xylonate dehydratase [Planctomycetota bacterium]